MSRRRRRSRDKQRGEDQPEPVSVLTPRGPIVARLKRRDRSKVAAHLNAVRRYLELGDDRRLAGFLGTVVQGGDGELLELVTDLATLDRLAEGGEVWFELYRS